MAAQFDFTTRGFYGEPKKRTLTIKSGRDFLKKRKESRDSKVKTKNIRNPNTRKLEKHWLHSDGTWRPHKEMSDIRGATKQQPSKLYMGNLGGTPEKRYQYIDDSITNPSELEAIYKYSTSEELRALNQSKMIDAVQAKNNELKIDPSSYEAMSGYKPADSQYDRTDLDASTDYDAAYQNALNRNSASDSTAPINNMQAAITESNRKSLTSNFSGLETSELKKRIKAGARNSVMKNRMRLELLKRGE
jgi:hypothetical protein